jgi:hypothetical protein
MFLLYTINRNKAKLIMNNINWEEKDRNERLLKSAVLDGDLKKLIYFTTSEEYKDKMDAACGYNYPLRGAALKGHMPIIEFLVNFPNKEKRKEITDEVNIKEAIEAALEHGQNEVYLYFKDKFPKGFKKFISTDFHNSILTSMTAKGYLSTIKLMAADVKDKSKWNYNSFIKSSIQYNQADCFKYFMKHFNKEKFNKKENLEEIAHTALYYEKFELLDKIIQNSNLDLKEHITINNFSILLESKFDSLKHIVMKYDYSPNEKLMNEIKICLKRNDDAKLVKDLNMFLKIMETNNLQKEIRSELVENLSKDSSKKNKI